jgi:hypothetical protein
MENPVPTMTRRLSLTLPLVALMAATAHAANELTVADVEAVSGLTGVALIAKNAIPGAGGDLNFVRADRKLLLLVNIAEASHYATAKQQFDKVTIVPGIGDEAFTPDTFTWVLYGRKGGRFFGLGSGLDPATGNPILNAAQLQRLGKLIVGRI